MKIKEKKDTGRLMHIMFSTLYICGPSIYYFELSIRFHIGFGVWIILVKVKILNDVFVVVRFIMF